MSVVLAGVPQQDAPLCLTLVLQPLRVATDATPSAVIPPPAVKLHVNWKTAR